MTTDAQRREIFEHVRDLPYDTTAAHDAAGLRAQGRGNCVAKASLLAELLAGAGTGEVRLVSWEYELPCLVEVQQELSFSRDVHTAAQVRIGESWVLVDATHDPALADLGLTVSSWDGVSATEPAYRPLGPFLLHEDREEDAGMGEGEGDAGRLDDVVRRIGQGVEATDPELVARYQRALNDLFESVRSPR